MSDTEYGMMIVDGEADKSSQDENDNEHITFDSLLGRPKDTSYVDKLINEAIAGDDNKVG